MTYNSLFEKRRKTPSGKALRSAQGEIATPDFSDFSESDFAETYKSGHNGLRNSNVRNERKVVQDDGEMRFSEIADAPSTRIQVTPEMKNLVAMFANHVEPTGSDWSFSEDQMHQFKRFFGDKRNQNRANELHRLRTQTAPMTTKDRVKKIKLETDMTAMKTQLTRIARSA